MTQKELLYVEDAIGHERVISQSIEEIIKQLEDESLRDYMNDELTNHQNMEESLLKLLEDIKNE